MDNEQFITDGFVRIDHAFPRALADAALAILWNATGCSRDHTTTWTQPVIRLGMFTQAGSRVRSRVVLLTLGHACGAVLVSAAFGAAWLTMLRAAGVSLAGMPAADAAWRLSPALLPLMASVVAPWSLSRIRHT
jgi:hypothetical protein